MYFVSSPGYQAVGGAIVRVERCRNAKGKVPGDTTRTDTKMHRVIGIRSPEMVAKSGAPVVMIPPCPDALNNRFSSVFFLDILQSCSYLVKSLVPGYSLPLSFS